MSHPNRHIFIVKDSGDFDPKSFKSKTIKSGVEIVVGKGINGDSTILTHEYQFHKDKFSFTEATDWMKKNDVKYLTAEEADKAKSTPSNDSVTSTRVSRVDYCSMEDNYNGNKNWMTEKMEKTPEGYLKGRAIITNVGVFTYKDPTGNMSRELRPPEEVFSEDSINSLSMKPLTDEHPQDMMNCENLKEHQKGYLGDTVSRDSFHLSAPIIITDPATVEAVNRGKTSLSAGYTVDIEQKPGVWMGVPYDCIQRNIRYNHVALVDQGRAGDAARLRMDCADAVCVDSDKSIISNQEEHMKVIKIDGVDYQAEAKVLETLSQTTEKLDTMVKSEKSLKDEIQTLKGKLDSAEADKVKLQGETKTAMDGIPALITKGVEEKLVLIDTARKAGVEVKADMKDEDIKKSVILKAYPQAKDKLDKADASYVQARFDAAVETLTANETTRQDNASQASDLANGAKGDEGKNADPVEKADSSKSREEMIKRMKEAHKKPVTGGNE